MFQEVWSCGEVTHIALNMMGLGFGFSAKDDGLTDYQKRASAGFGKMGDAVLAAAAHAEKYTSAGMNLTTGLEATRVANNASAKSMLANAGMTGDALKKASRQATAMAESLNLTGDATGRAIVAFEDARPAMQALGLQASDLAKLESISGTRATDTAEAFNRLKSETQLTDAQLKSVESSLIKSGAATKDVGGQILFMKDSIRLLSRAQAVGVKDLGGYLEGILNASAGFRAFTKTTADSRDFTTQLTESLVQGQEGMQGLLAGVQQDVPGLIKELAIMNQDIGKSFEQASKNPEKFVELFAQMGIQAKKQGGVTANAVAFLRSRLQEATDPKFAAVLTNIMDQGVEGLAKFKDATKGMPDSIEKINKGYDDRRTRADRLTLAEDQLEAKLRAISSLEVGKFVKEAGKEYNAFGDTVTKLAQGNGPLADLITKSSEIAQLGAMAFVPKGLRATVGAIANTAKVLGPALAGLVTRFTSFTGILGSATEALGFVALSVAVNEKKLKNHGEAVKATTEMVKTWIQSGVDEVMKFVKGAPQFFDDLKQVYAGVNEVLKKAWNDLYEPYIKPGLEKAWTATKKFLGGIWDGMRGELDPNVKKDDATKLGEAVGNIFRAAFDMAVAGFDKYIVPALEKLLEKVLAYVAKKAADNPGLSVLLGYTTGGIGGAATAGLAIGKGLLDRGKAAIGAIGADMVERQNTTSPNQSVPSPLMSSKDTPAQSAALIKAQSDHIQSTEASADAVDDFTSAVQKAASVLANIVAPNTGGTSTSSGLSGSPQSTRLATNHNGNPLTRKHKK